MRYHFSLDDVLRPFEVIINYVKANYQPLLAFYGAKKQLRVEYRSSIQTIEKSAENYINFLLNTRAVE